MQPATKQSHKVKFATQVDPEILSTLREMASNEGRLLQSLIDEALREYIERKQGTTPRKHVMQAFQASVEQFGTLYQELAK